MQQAILISRLEEVESQDIPTYLPWRREGEGRGEGERGGPTLIYLPIPSPSSHWPARSHPNPIKTRQPLPPPYLTQACWASRKKVYVSSSKSFTFAVSIRNQDFTIRLPGQSNNVCNIRKRYYCNMDKDKIKSGHMSVAFARTGIPYHALEVWPFLE